MSLPATSPATTAFRAWMLTAALFAAACATDSGASSASPGYSAAPSDSGARYGQNVQASDPSVRPLWVEQPEAVYPPGRFMNGVGMGRTEEMARNAAKASLASIFRTQIQSVLTVYESETASSGGGRDLYSATRQLVRASTDKELQGVWVAETWFGKDARVFYAVALLDRQQALAGIAAEVQALDDFFRRAALILEGKAPLVVRRAAIQMTMEKAPEPPPQEPKAAEALPPAPVPAVQPAPSKAAPATRWPDVVANAENAFEALDRETEPERFPEEEPAPAVSPSKSEPSAPAVSAALSEAPEPQPAPSAPQEDASKTLSASEPQPDSNVTVPDAAVSDDVYLAQSSRLQKARLAQKIAQAAAKRRLLMADMRIISPNGASIPPPSALPHLENWASSALRDLRIRVQISSEKSPASANSASAAAIQAGAARSLADLGLQLAQSADEADLILSAESLSEQTDVQDGWFWSRASVQVSMVDAASGDILRADQKSGKKAAQNAAEAAQRLNKYLSDEVGAFVRQALTEGL